MKHLLQKHLVRITPYIQQKNANYDMKHLLQKHLVRTRIVRGSDYSPAIALSEDKDILRKSEINQGL